MTVAYRYALEAQCYTTNTPDCYTTVFWWVANILFLWRFPGEEKGGAA